MYVHVYIFYMECEEIGAVFKIRCNWADLPSVVVFSAAPDPKLRGARTEPRAHSTSCTKIKKIDRCARRITTEMLKERKSMSHMNRRPPESLNFERRPAQRPDRQTNPNTRPINPLSPTVHIKAGLWRHRLIYNPKSAVRSGTIIGSPNPGNSEPEGGGVYGLTGWMMTCCDLMCRDLRVSL